ncbi:hypothetical protein VE03_10673 [Pseudogymnoascus sp. 23342-1-I1]|nr:hypothetical protein VE03_10673 [Pseudogymnoascus sp. 23342-1-I1]
MTPELPDQTETYYGLGLTQLFQLPPPEATGPHCPSLAFLRRHLLWEHKHKNQTASAAPKRHAAHDVSNLKQYPDKMHLGTEDNGYHGSWSQYFGQGFEYHSKGW